MTRRQRKRLIGFLGGVIFTLCLGMVIGTVYAGNLDKNDREEENEELTDILENGSAQVVKEVSSHGRNEKEQEEELKSYLEQNGLIREKKSRKRKPEPEPNVDEEESWSHSQEGDAD